MDKLARPDNLETTSPKKPDGFQFGQYFLEKRLAHGGMAEVFVGRDTEDPESDRRCVVKCILPDLATDEQFLAMFLNEAQLAAQMEHANVVKVMDFGEQDGLLYMAMEYVDGLDCWRLFRRIYPFGDDHEGVVAYIISEVLNGLDYVHNMRDVNGQPLHVVHRDMSPSNIYLSRTGAVKLGDFGIARIESPRYRPISYTPRGKFGYVAPEQIEGNPVDIRSDIFSVGIVMAELLIGQKLFQGPSQLSVLLEIRDGRFLTLEQNAERISEPLRRILYTALALKPENRYPSASVFRDALLAVTGDRIGTPDVLAAFVVAARQIGEKRRTLTVLDRTNAPDVPTDAATDAIARKSKRPRNSFMPTNPNGGAPTVWDILGEDIDDADDFSSFDEFDDLEETPITNDYDAEAEWQYTVELGLNRIVGPISFASVMELICEDRIGPETLISLNGGPFAAASNYPELARHIPEYTPTLSVEEIKNPDRRGVFAVEAPPAVILSLAMARETGLLVCKSAKRRKEVYFRDGNPVYASSNETKDLLGEYLVSQGIITDKQLKSALELLPRFDGHMGDTLVALGMVSAVDLFRAIASQIKMRFADLLFWRNGVYELFRETTCRQNEPEIPIEPYHFVTDALVAYAKTLNAGEVLDSMAGAIIDVAPNAEVLLGHLHLPDIVYSYIRVVTEPVVLTSLASSSSMEPLVVALYVALETGIWSLEGAQPPWRREQESPESD